MQNQNQMKTGTIALTNFFKCETTEEHTSFPEVHIVAELIIERGEIHHVNIDEIKAALENAVKNAVWYIEKKKAQVPGEK